MQVTNKEADKYQDLFNLMYKKHKVTLTIDEMNELIDEAKKISRLDVVSEIEVIDTTPIEEKSCRNCIYNGQQMIHPGNCTGCGAQEHRNHVYSR